MNDFDEIRSQLSRFIEVYIAQARDLITQPSAFFRALPKRRGYLEPTLFAAGSLLVPKLLYGLILAPLTLGLSLLWVIPSLIYGLLFVFTTSVLLYAIIRLFGKDAAFEPVYAAACYCCIANYLMMIPVPFVGLALFLAAYCFLLYTALRQMFDLTPQQCALTVLVPALLNLTAGALLTLASLWLIVMGLLKIVYWFL